MKIFGFNAAKNEPSRDEPTQSAGDTALLASDTAPTQDVAAPESLDEQIISSDDAPISQDTASASDDSAIVPPPPELSEPPRALPPGAFLNGEYEIKEVIARGLINFYLADAGDYGAHDYKLVAERSATRSEVENGPDNEFFPPATRFVQDEREYAVWDWQNLQNLEEWSAKPNDETYLCVVGAVARGFSSLETAGLKTDLPRESLFFDAAGSLLYFGFFDDRSDLNPAPMSAVEQLSALSSRFAKTNMARGATLRLDDEFAALPFSAETKTFAKSLSDGEFNSASEVVAALEAFIPFRKTDIALLSDVGMERELNEDCGLVWKLSRAGHARNLEIEVLAVADGMGGHEGGEVASELTLSSLETAIAQRPDLDWANNGAILGAMAEILGEVNDAVVRLTENPPYASMRAKPGSTLVCALRVGGRVFVGNIGDSRAYRWNEKLGLERLTKDHSYVQDLLDSGSLTEEQSWGHPDGSVITSHVGMMRGLKKDVYLRLLSAGDRLVLVSDGVVDTLHDTEIETIIAQNEDVNLLCAALVNAANDAGGIDNITVAALICK